MPTAVAPVLPLVPIMPPVVALPATAAVPAELLPPEVMSPPAPSGFDLTVQAPEPALQSAASKTSAQYVRVLIVEYPSYTRSDRLSQAHGSAQKRQNG